MSLPRANSTRDKLVTMAKPATPGANSKNDSASGAIWSDFWVRTCAAGRATAIITAVLSRDSSMTARFDPALVRSKASPSVADSTGKALITTAIGSTEQIAVNTRFP